MARSGFSLARELLTTLLMAAAVFVLVQFSVRNYRVEGFSMMPSLHDGELVLVNKLAYLRLKTEGLLGGLSFLDRDKNGILEPFGQPARGDVIVFYSVEEEDRFLVKRVSGVPGDTVEIRRGLVYSNGTRVDERDHITSPGVFSMPPTVIPQGEYWVMGDNRTGSSDSRSWGTLPRDKIVGKAWIAYWPLREAGFVDAPRF